MGRNKRKNTRKAGVSDKALKCLYLREQSGQMMKELELLAWDRSDFFKGHRGGKSNQSGLEYR